MILLSRVRIPLSPPIFTHRKPTSSTLIHMITKRIVCLANSKMNRRRCVAGVEIDQGNNPIVPISWIRLVGEDSELPMSTDPEVIGLEVDECDFNVLDVLTVQLSRHKPIEHQTENWEINWGYWLKKETDRFEISNLPLITTNSDLWTYSDKAMMSLRNKVKESSIRVTHSLELIFATDVDILKVKKYGRGEQFRIGFIHNDQTFDLPVTDRIVKCGSYSGCYLTVSLSLERFKIVATVIPIKEASRI